MHVRSGGSATLTSCTISSNFAGVYSDGGGFYIGDGGSATAAQLNEPYDIAFNSIGELFITDVLNHRIRKIDNNGIISTFAGTGDPTTAGDGGPATSAKLRRPKSLAFDSKDNLYIGSNIATSNNATVRKIDSNVYSFEGNIVDYDVNSHNFSEAID